MTSPGTTCSPAWGDPPGLVVVDDPAWRDAGPEEIGEALERDDPGNPDPVGIMVVDLAIANQDVEDCRGPDTRARFHGTE
ncbi:hypothetical protein [Nocardiopsis tropica]|uniref:Uncharacterized protein n=1 Tax=Nocardiopsis tropica TaxID=109330 RepID=A0ABV1ZXH9_9ACTN